MADEEQTPQEIVSEEPEYKDLWLRAQADLENLRKRSEGERANLLKFGQSSLLEELLPIVDNFDRATKAVPTEAKDAAWVTGIQYIQKNLMDVLTGHGVSILEVKLGGAYDPHTQEALATVPSDEVAEGHIVGVIANGYKLHDRLLRPAQVTVAEAQSDKQE